MGRAAIVNPGFRLIRQGVVLIILPCFLFSGFSDGEVMSAAKLRKTERGLTNLKSTTEE